MRVWLSSGALLLAGCASPPAPPPQGWSGKLGYQVEASASQRPQAGAALFELQGDARVGLLRLDSPLGATLVRALWAEDGLWLEDGQGRRRFADLDELGLALGEALQGPALPLRALFDWLHGRPAPGRPHQAVEGGFEQDGWRVQHHPERLLLSRPAQGGQGAIQLRILLQAPAP